MVMSRLGPWEPADADARLDRLESLAEIRQLPVRYALALDSRDMDMLVSLFTPDVRVGRERARTRRVARLVREDAERTEDVGALRRQPHRRLRRRRPRARHRVLPRRARPTRTAAGTTGCCSTGTRTCASTVPPARSGASTGASSCAGTWSTRWNARTTVPASVRTTTRSTTNQLPEAFESWGRFWAEVGIRPVRLEHGGAVAARARRCGPVQHRPGGPQRHLVAAVDRAVATTSASTIRL